MAFINFDNREDMQDDTYKIVAIRLDQALTAIIWKEADMAYSLIEALFLLVGSRLKEEEPEIEKELKVIGNMLFQQGKPLDDQGKSAALDMCKVTYAKITKSLDRAGILFRAEAKVDELYKRGSHG